MTDIDFCKEQAEHIADALQELMASGGPAAAQQGLVEAINSWYDYHYQEMSKWSTIKRLLERPL